MGKENEKEKVGSIGRKLNEYQFKNKAGTKSFKNFNLKI